MSNSLNWGRDRARRRAASAQAEQRAADAHLRAVAATGAAEIVAQGAATPFASVRELGGAGAIRDRAWWAEEAARLGTDWPGVLRSAEAAVEICRRRAAPEQRGAA